MSKSNTDKTPETPADTSTRGGGGLSSDALFSCPFCGKSEEDGYPIEPSIQNGHEQCTDIDERGLPPYYIQCSYCMAQGPTADNPVDASNWWNDYKIVASRDQENAKDLPPANNEKS